ncbi:MAG: hypothetical protein JRH15_18550 [Deltaproteobacteria bacterium]|nr:hypothetical protein [Deltaproteobacteria bacterium]
MGVDSIDGLKSITWPTLGTPERLVNARDVIKQLGEQYAIVAGDPVGGVFAQGFRMRGYENFYLDLAANPVFACALMDKFTEIKLQYWDAVLSEIGDLVDVVIFEDDLGEQDRPMISPKMYRELVKPRHTELFSMIKKKTDGKVKVLLHTDGSVYDLIPDIIEAGADIINPVQVSCAKMDSKTLKKDFGKDICFWGGAADSQNVLGSGTPDQVSDEVKRRLDDLAPGGGYVCASIHNIQPDVPPENFVAMWETLKAYGKY